MSKPRLTREQIAARAALELPDGQTLLLTFLCEGQEATVLQLPAKPTSIEEAQAQFIEADDTEGKNQ